MIAIGIGCRRGASKEAITSLVAQALARIAPAEETLMLFTHEGKSAEAGLLAAAAALELPLHFLSLEVLDGVRDRVVTASPAAQKALGIASVAEASALAGCGERGQLLVARIVGDGVTCAIAKGFQE